MKSVLKAHFFVSWRYCLRARALWGVLVLGFAVLLIAWLAASFSLRQPLVVAVDVGYSGLRILGAFLTVFWVQDVFFRDIDKRLVLSTFAFPISRQSYVLGRFAGITAIILCAVVIWAFGLYGVGVFSDWGYSVSSRPVFGSGYVWVMLGFVVDLVLIGAFTLVVVSAAETPLVPILAGVSFALAARSLGSVIGYLELALDAEDPLRTGFLPWLQGLRWVLPDLGRLDLREAVLYGKEIDLRSFMYALSAIFGYLMIMLLLAIRNYDKREFS